MERKDILKTMNIAFREDRERFLKATDYCSRSNKLTDEQKAEIERLREWFRNATDLPDYPNIDFPPAIPSYCPNPCFSRWEKDKFIEESLQEELEYEDD